MDWSLTRIRNPSRGFWCTKAQSVRPSIRRSGSDMELPPLRGRLQRPPAGWSRKCKLSRRDRVTVSTRRCTKTIMREGAPCAVRGDRDFSSWLIRAPATEAERTWRRENLFVLFIGSWWCLSDAGRPDR